MIDLTQKLVQLGLMTADEHYEERRALRAAGLVPDAPASRLGTSSSAQARIDEIMGDPTHAYYNREAPGHADAVRLVSKLFAETSD